MGIFDKLIGGQREDKSLNPREAFASVLLSVIAADGHVSDDEVRAFNTVINRMQLYREQTSDQFSVMLDELVGLLKRGGPNALLEKAAQVLPKELKETAFVTAVDFALADGSVGTKEREALEGLQQSLGVPDDLAAKVVEVIAIKNSG